MPATPQVSVVLPTFRRPASLQAALDRLADQSGVGFDWELIVVDNDDPPGCQEQVDAAAAAMAVPVSYVRAAERGACNARNAGLARARGSVTAFCDDDVVPSRDWLQLITEPVLSGRYDGAAGRVDLDWDGDRPRWLSASLDGYLAHYVPYDTETELGPEDFLLTASVAFRTDLLRATGGFDPVLGPRDGVPIVNDDTDIFRRFRAAGGRVGFVPAARSLHELPARRLKPRYLVERIYAQGRSDFRLERSDYVGQSMRGVPAVMATLLGKLWQRAREGFWHPAVAYTAVCDVARLLGFVREALASFRPSWEGHRPPPPAGASEVVSSRAV